MRKTAYNNQNLNAAARRKVAILAESSGGCSRHISGQVGVIKPHLEKQVNSCDSFGNHDKHDRFLMQKGSGAGYRR